jgi:Domain of unknown function (DUF4159)
VAAAPRARNFGIKDSDIIPEDPREFMNGEFAAFPTWPLSKDLPNDVFTFARVIYPSYNDGMGSGRRRGRFSKWMTDYPDSDMNLSYRLQQMTSLQVNPNGAVVDIDAEQLRHYPFLYMTEMGDNDVTDEQAKILREYMLSGGFIMVDDFWGTDEWETFYVAFKKMWPDRNFVELELDHDIFHCVFDLKVKPQIPGIGYGMRGKYDGSMRTYEWGKDGAESVHYRAVNDDKGRMCMIICWNTDTGDGWEEEGTDPWYFKTFSEPYAYPIGINIIYYAMTR